MIKQIRGRVEDMYPYLTVADCQIVYEVPSYVLRTPYSTVLHKGKAIAVSKAICYGTYITLPAARAAVSTYTR